MNEEPTESEIREAVSRAHAGQYSHAYLNLDKLRARFPRSIRVLTWKGNLLEEEALTRQYRTGISNPSDSQLQQALSCYEEAYGLCPEDGVVLRDLGEALARQGRTDDALKFLQKSLQTLNPSDEPTELEEAYSVTINTLLEAGKPAEAAILAKQAVARMPSSAELRLLIARLSESGKIDK